MNRRLERVSKMLEIELSSAPPAVQAAGGRIAHAMLFDDLPDREDLAMAMVFLLERRARAHARAEVRRRKAREKRSSKGAVSSVMTEEDRAVSSRASPGSGGKPHLQRAAPSDRPPRPPRASRSREAPPVETAFSRLLDEDDDEAVENLRRKLGLSPRKIRRTSGGVFITGDGE